jgi:pimeloyl-ACP methyl ester carboxylesterase
MPNGKLGLKRDLAIQSDFIPLQLWHYVEKLKMPFLLLIGSESAIVDPDQQKRFREIRPDLWMITVHGAGHQIVHDKLDEFEGIIRAFLQRNGL